MPRFEVLNKADEARAKVYIYGDIGETFWGDGITAKEFAEQLDAIDADKPVDIHIDSGGGDVYAGFAIASAIQRHGGETTAYIDGMAASAASYVAAVCDRVVMNDYSTLMIHDSWACCAGNAGQLREMASRLDVIDEAIAGVLSKRSALTYDEVREAMHAETWYTAEEAAEVGFCDAVVETGEKVAACVSREAAKACRNLPDWVTVADAAPEDVATSHAPDTMTADNPEAGRAVLLGNKVVRL